MSEVQIARFVDMDACRTIFSDSSTFVLRSSVYYRRKDETCRGDKQELKVKVVGSGSAEWGNSLLSCWTRLDGHEPTQDEWCIFSDSVVAIVSTPSKVRAFLKKVFEIKNGEMRDGRRFPFLSVTHKAVEYADEVAEITSDNIMDQTIFVKRKKFENQKEYRFALPYCGTIHSIVSYIFAATPGYMKKCFVNPQVCGKDKQELRQILLEAMCGYGHFQGKKISELIANSDILF